MFDELEDEATRLLISGDHPARIRLIEKALEDNPGQRSLYHKLTYALRDAGEWERAIALCRDQVAAHPNHYNPRCTLLSILDEAGQREAALHELAEIERLEIWVYEREIALGSTLVSLGKVEEGLARMRAEIDRCINEGSTYTAGYLRIFAECLERLGRTDEALDALQQGVVVEPDDGWAHGKLAEYLHHKGCAESALTEARIAAELLPENTYTLLLWADCAEKTGNFDEALTACEQAFSTVTYDTSFLDEDREMVRCIAFAQLAAVLLGQGKAEQALAQIELILPHYDHNEAHLLRGRILAALGRDREARAVFTEVGREGGDYWAHQARALLAALNSSSLPIQKA